MLLFTGPGALLALNGATFLVSALLLTRLRGLAQPVESWGFGAALLAGGVLASTVGGRVTFALAGSGALVVWAAARSRLMPSRPAKETLMPMMRR